MDKLSKEEILAANPHINSKEFEKASEKLDKMDDVGKRGPGYRLVSPASGKRISIGSTKYSKTVYLGRLSRNK